MRRWHAVLLGAAVVLGIAARDTDPLERPVLPATASERDRPKVETFCSETLPSAGIVVLTWQDYGRLDHRRRIDLTVYKNGFDQDRYASLWPLERGQQARALKVSKLRDRPADPALLARLTSLSSDPRQGVMTVQLEGLEGGLIYGIRLATLSGQGWRPGPIVRVQAPACITEPFGETESP